MSNVPDPATRGNAVPARERGPASAWPQLPDGSLMVENEAWRTVLDGRNRFAFVNRIQTAVRPETRTRRIEQLTDALAQGKTPIPGTDEEVRYLAVPRFLTGWEATG